MNIRSDIKGLLIISFNLMLLAGIGFLWMLSIKEQRSSRLKGYIIELADDSNTALLEKKDVEKWVRLFYKKEIQNISIYALRLKELEDFLHQQPLVDEVEVFVDGKGRLHIQLMPRVPIVRVIDQHSRQFYLDREGFVIPVSSQYASRVPVATGALNPVNGMKLDKKQQLFYGSLIRIAEAIRADSFANSLVEQIDQDANGEFTLIPKIGNEKILLGGSDMIEDKLDRLKLFYSENMGRQGWNVYQTISVKFKGQIVGKKSNQES